MARGLNAPHWCQRHVRIHGPVAEAHDVVASQRVAIRGGAVVMAMHVGGLGTRLCRVVVYGEDSGRLTQ